MDVTGIPNEHLRSSHLDGRRSLLIFTKIAGMAAAQRTASAEDLCQLLRQSFKTLRAMRIHLALRCSYTCIIFASRTALCCSIP